jgi:hypothetical protein
MSHNLFYELIQVSLGTRLKLSLTPTADDWDRLYKQSQKQTILGVCFNGVNLICSKYPEQAKELPRDLRLRWVGLAVNIQSRNEWMNQNCVAVYEQLKEAGFCSCIIKGQGVASLYGPDLSELRQPGDIDVWVKDADIERLAEYMRYCGVKCKATFAHAEGDLLEGVPVELHATPAFFRNFRYNHRLQKWCESYDWDSCKTVNGFSVPSDSFNLVFLLVHLYHHFLYEGVGFRQLMDYYELLRSIDAADRPALYKEAAASLKSFGMWRFTQGVMFLMSEVFGMSPDLMLCEPDEKVGKMLIKDILESGNMGKYHSNKKRNRDNRIIWHWTNFRRNLGFLSMTPAEILSAPFWSLWHWCWRKKRGML